MLQHFNPVNKTGEDKKEWKYFEVVDYILGTGPSTKPEVLVSGYAKRGVSY